MNTELISDICHLSTRLQSASMIHAANVRGLLPGDPIEALGREAVSLLAMTERLAFKVGQLQASIASEVRRPRLDDHMTLAAKPEAERLEPIGMLADTEGGSLD
jgi:hypothetical protein